MSSSSIREQHTAMINYNDGYQSQERPYAGPAAPGPGPRRRPEGPPRPRQFDGYHEGLNSEFDNGNSNSNGNGNGYNNGYGYDQGYGNNYERFNHDDYDGGYGHVYDDYYEDNGRHDWNHEHGGQYHDGYYGRGGSNRGYSDRDHFNGPMRGSRGQPPPQSRGGMMPPFKTIDGSGGAPYPPRGGPAGRSFQPGRGVRPGPVDRAPRLDPMSSRLRQPSGSPQTSGFGGSPFPTFPGQRAKTDSEREADILSNMIGEMDVSRDKAPMRGEGAFRGPRGGEYGPRGPSRTSPYQGQPDPRRGAPPEPRYGRPMDNEYGYRDNGYGSPPRDHYPRYADRGATMHASDTMPNFPSSRRPDEFGPPARTQTMPLDDRGRDPGSLRRVDSVPADVPLRSTTSHGYRSASHAMSPPSQRPPVDGLDQIGRMGSSSNGDGFDVPPQRQSSDLGANTGGGPGMRSNNPGYHLNAPPRRMAEENQDYVEGSGSGSGSLRSGSFHLSSPQSRPALKPTQDLSRTKSQPDLRRPPGELFEMAGNVPPIPLEFKPYRPSTGSNEGRFDEKIALASEEPPPLVRRTTGMQIGLPARPSPHVEDPDALPAHPTPIRPGLNSEAPASMKDRPPPVRNYNYDAGQGQNGGIPAAPGGGGGPKPPPVRNYAGTSQGSATAKAGPQRANMAPAVTREELESLKRRHQADLSDRKVGLEYATKLIEARTVLFPNPADQKPRDQLSRDALKVLKKLAGASDAEAMFFLADCHGNGRFGSGPDHKEAFTLYQSAAKLGHAAAAYRTAVCCEIGSEDGGGTRKDPPKAVQWYKRAATLGDTAAMYKMGMIQLKGLLGQPKSQRDAIGWLKRAAECADAENPHALHELGLLYQSASADDVIIRDEAYALSLFKRAAELGYKFSQFRLGCAYEYGLMGLPIEPRKSIKWYSDAAAQEEHQSELALSGWYLTGSDGVLGQSDMEAYLWARKAAIAGLPKAEYAMGYFAEVGIGVPANLDDAKRWYWRAAAQDFPKARERLEDLKRTGRSGARQVVARGKSEKPQEGECVVM